MTPPHLAILHTASVPEEIFSEFRSITASDNLNLSIISREDGGIYAAIEWLIPTAVIVYIGKSYFDGFLKEMGKDHYALLKNGLKTLRAKFLGSNAPVVTVVASEGKSSNDQPYSLFFSIVAEADQGLSFKLLLQREVTETEYEEIISAFLTFLESYHDRSLDSNSVEKMGQARVVGRTMLFVFNPQTKTIEPIDPVPSRQVNKK